MAASMAKAAAGDCQRITVQHGVQVFGGLGFTWENDLQLFVRRAKAGELPVGVDGRAPGPGGPLCSWDLPRASADATTGSNEGATR